MNKAKFISFASVVSEIKQSDMFMTVKARMLETPKANLNGARVTEAFVDEVISNEERYVGLPLYADTKALLSGRYNSLGHLYNSKTGEFHSTQIGSFYQFEKESFEGGAYLVGYARIPKRNKQLSKAIAELFAESALKFSFEIACGDWIELEDGTIEIDASESNYLEGMAIVSFPACEDAVALEFVAQREADDPERGDEKMAEVEKLETEQEELVAETEAAPVEPVEEVAEEQPTETAEEKVEEAEETEEETEEASCKKKTAEETETAAVYVHESTTVTETVNAYDTETGAEAFQRVEVTTGKTQQLEGTLTETDSGIAVAEDETPGETQNQGEQNQNSGENGTGNNANEQEPAVSADDDLSVPEDEKKKKTAEVETEASEPAAKTAEEMIAELANAVKLLAEEIESLKEQRIVASQTITAEAANPFVDSITAQGNKYDLLERVDKVDGRSLLSR